MQKLFIIILFLLTSLLNASPYEKLSIQLKWKHGFQFAGYYAAIEKGFYKEQGLDVTLKEVDLSRNFIKDVAEGKSEYGISDSSLVVYHSQKIPIVLVSQIFQHSPLVLISHRNSNITTPYDMIGKKITYSVNGTGGTPFRALILKTIGNFEDVNISDFTSYQDFIDKKVDITSAYSTSQPYWLKKKGIEVNIIDPKSYGIDFYGDNFFTTQKELKEHPKRVEKMRKATLKGWEYALSHQKEIIDIILKKYAPNKERDALEFEARGTYQMIMPDLIDLGTISKKRYEQVTKTYHQLGIRDNEKIEDSFFYTSDQNSISLSNEEKTWIKQHPQIIVGGGPDWAPFDFLNSKGIYTGIANDYLNLISEKTGLKFDIHIDKWSNNLQKIKESKIDLLDAVYYTEQRAKYMSYTKPYFEMLDYFFIRDDLNISSIKDLDGKRVAMPKGYAHGDILKKEFPNIKIVTVDTFVEAIDAVLENHADALFDTYVSLSYVLKKNSISTIVPFKSHRSGGSIKLHMSTPKNEPILANIIDKGLMSITNSEKEKIYNRWIGKTKSKKTVLTEDEEKYLLKNPTVIFTGHPNWLPFEAFDKNGHYIGIVADYLKELEKELGVTFKPVIVKTWEDSLTLSSNRDVDLISGDISDVVLLENYDPISPYFTTPIVAITKNEHNFINDLQDLKDKKIAIVKGYGYTNEIYKKYPNNKFVEVKNTDEAFDNLLNNHVQAVLLSLPVASYMIKTRGLNGLKIAGKTVIQMQPTLFVNRDKPLLKRAIEKAMKSIHFNKHSQILGKWQEVKFAEKIDYQLLFQIAGLLGFFLLGTIYWNRKLSREVVKRKEVETQLQTLIDNIPLQIIVSQYDGKVMMANPFTFDYYNVKNDYLYNSSVLDFYDNQKDREWVLAELKIKGKVHNKIVKFQHPDGSKRDMMISILPISYEKQNALLSIAVDMSERLEMEKALSIAKEEADKANLAKSEFLANMSHEIRTPMNSVLGFSELLAKLINDPIQKDYLDSIMRGGNTLLNIINDILDLSKIEAGKLEIVLESVDIKQLALEMESIFAVKLIQKNIHFKLDIDPTLPKYLLLDNTRIRQILFNLIGNAIKFTHHGSVTLGVKKSFDEVEKSKIDLQIYVEDSGIGIPKENIEYIFDAFEQQRGQDSQKYGGTGLGLAISKKLAVMMGGTICVESQVDIGSKFIIDLPDIPISSVETNNIKKKKSLNHIQFQKATILVVDDIKDNRKLVISTLNEYSLEVAEAENGKDAIELLQNVKIDLIFMDIKMPIMDGYTATKIIKNDEKLKEIPLIALTASVMGRDLKKIKEYQFDGYLRKPVSQEKLVSQLEQFLKHTYLELEDEAEENIDTAGYENLPRVIKALEDKYTPTWEEIKEMGDFTLIATFAKSIEELGSQNGINILSHYAKELQANCESFDIDKIDFMMNSFLPLIEKFKNIVGTKR